MLRHIRIPIFLAMTALALGGSNTQADTLSYSDSVALTMTDWSDSVSITQFDPTLGTLQSVTVSLSSNVQGDMFAESLDNAASIVTLSLQADVTLTGPGGSSLLVVNPSHSEVVNFTDFDGTIDFAGTSGASFLGVMGSDSNSITTSDPGDLALYTGLGSLILPVGAIAQSSGSGSGNLITQFNTSADALVTVTYNYTPTTVPEPSSLALMGIGGLGLVGGYVRRSRRKRA